MPLQLRDLQTEARNLARAGQLTPALALQDHMLAANPLDAGARRRIGDLLLRLGDAEGAVEVLRTVALHDVRSGHLLPGLVGCKLLESLGQPSGEIVAAMARNFGHGAPAMVKFAARQAPVDLDAPIEALAPSAAADPAKVARRARARALDLSVFVQYPEQFLAAPFFSELPPELFPEAVRMLRLLRGNDGDLVVRQGDPGSAFYFVASGQVRVVAGAPGSAPIERTRLLEGALFGEMALLTEQPRTASVQVVGEADLLEVSRAAVAALVATVPVLAERLDHFAHERLLKNLLATSPLFKPFDHQQQMDLIRRFEGIDVAAGTVIIRENEVGQGLFLILLGEVEVLRTDDIEGRQGRVACLQAGDVFGEMALLAEGPTTATVRAITPTTILFLGRDYFRRLVDALPALRQYFEELSRSRS
ncbi:MAG TPA: cyclic nucleotide-binding domain-containing protein [Polyangia bacterium]|nr:cyclic nucleotide-binding domain-containing protein [Polyangia bacterium]